MPISPARQTLRPKSATGRAAQGKSRRPPGTTSHIQTVLDKLWDESGNKVLAPQSARYDLFRPSDQGADLAVREVANHCSWFVDTTAACLTALLKQRVSLAVKFLWLADGQEEPVLHTLCRSTNTRAKREAYDPHDNFKYIENTAFREILHGWPKIRVFASNDLLDKWFEGVYANSNRRWMNFYNSTVVVPIPQSKDGRTLPVGFLCADSLVGKLDRPDVIQAIGEAASHLYDVLGILFSNSEKSALSPVDEEPTRSLHLPCGWRYDGGQLIATDLPNQQRFQQILDAIEHVYSPERKASAVSSAKHSVPPAEEEDTPMNDDEFVAGYDDLAYDGTRRDRSRVAPPTPEAINEILERMSVHNPDAAEILKRRRA